MDFIAIIMLHPEIAAANPRLTPLHVSRIEGIERHAGTPVRESQRNKVNNIQVFHVSRAAYNHYNVVAHFPASLDEINEIENYI